MKTILLKRVALKAEVLLLDIIAYRTDINEVFRYAARYSGDFH